MPECCETLKIMLDSMTKHNLKLAEENRRLDAHIESDQQDLENVEDSNTDLKAEIERQKAYIADQSQRLETVTKERDEAFNSMAAMTDTRLWEHAIKRAEAAELQLNALRPAVLNLLHEIAEDGDGGQNRYECYGDVFNALHAAYQGTENRVESPKTCANCGGTSPLRPSGLCKSCADSTAEFNALTEKRLGVPNPEPELCIVCERNSVTPPKRICFPCGEAAGR